MKETQKSLENLCRLFLRFMASTEKLSKSSLKAYTGDLRELLDLGEISRAKPPFPAKIKNKKKLENSIKILIEKNTAKLKRLSNSSRNRKMASARSFIKWLADQDYIEEDFRHLFKSSKAPVRLPVFLSVDEVFSILEMFKKEEGKAFADRDKALFFLLYGGGLRVSEACQLKIKDIGWDSRTLRIKGKGGKERLVSLPAKAFEKLKALRSGGIYLFGEKPLPIRKAYNIIKSMGQKAGILKPLRPHALRHSFATHMLLGGSSLRVLQELLGHKTLATTQKYTHLDLAYLSKTLEMYHPLREKSAYQ